MQSDVPELTWRDRTIRAICMTVPGHAWYDHFRRHVAAGADVVVFVADPRPERLDQTEDAWFGLRERWDGPVVVFGDTAALPFPFDGVSSADHVQVLARALRVAMQRVAGSGSAS